MQIKDPNEPFFEAILFDMDGTLVDTEPFWLRAETELMAEYGYEWTLQDQGNCLGGPLSKVGEYMSPLSGNAETPDFFTNLLIERMEYKLRHHGVKLMEGAQELMELSLQNSIPTALVSASPRILVDAAMADIQSANFQFTISCDDVIRTKPDPEGYLLAAQKLGVSIQNCLILEDSVNGVAAAKASGAWVVAIPHLVPITESERVAVVSSLHELSIEGLLRLYKKWRS